MTSIWSAETAFDRRQPLTGDKKADVLVIGGGITGLLTAYFLKSKGAVPVVIEAERIAGGVTKNTTAKITSQHNVIYSKITEKFGSEKARQYAEANERAIRAYEALIEEKHIDCRLERISANLYAAEDPRGLEREYRDAAALGLPVFLEDKSALPMDVRAVLRFENQAQFNPLAFLKELAKELEIYEDTRALQIEGGRVTTERGVIQAEKIVLATHFPFINTPGYYFIRMHQERSYVIALENAPGAPWDAYLGVDGGQYSLRRYRDYVIFGGGGHRTGANKVGGKYDGLIGAARRVFPESRVAFQWSAQDCVTHDGIPYIGKFSAETENLYVATGFGKWGMTSAMVAAMRLSDELLGKRNDYTVFSPQRRNIAVSVPGLFADTAQAVSGLVRQNLVPPAERLGEVPPGQAAVIEYRGEKTGVYKRADGVCHMVSTKCPHLGCQLQWNPDERSWDCPCHGSRFDYRGKLINNPAQTDLDGEEGSV